MHPSSAATQGRAPSSASSNPPNNSITESPNNPAHSAALKGATLAFRAQNPTKSPSGAADRPGPNPGPGPTPAQIPPKPNPKPRPPPSAKDNGALQAATQAARESSHPRQRSPAGTSVSRHPTGGSISVVASPDHHLAPPGHQQTPNPDSRSSASYIAATLAASRTGSPTPGPGFATSPLAATFKDEEECSEGRLGDGRASPRMSPRLSAVGRGGEGVQSVVDDGSVSPSDGRTKNRVKPPVVSRKPKVAPRGEMTAARKRETTPPPVHHPRRPVTELISPESQRIIKTPQLEPPQLPARSSAASTKIIPRRALSQSSASSDDSFVSASSTQSPRTMSPVKYMEPPSPSPSHNPSLPPRRSTQANIPRSYPLHPSPSPCPRPEPTWRLTSPNTSSPSNSSLALDSLTNAIVASNLASARLAAQSSSPGPPPLPAPRRHKHRPGSPQYLQPQRTADSLHRDRTGGSSRSPGGRPQQQDPKHRTGMLRTLRAPYTSLSDDEDARRRTHRTRKKTMHPLSGGKKHAHNEGSRRRWRDEVSPRERRRYEAVWASNRGLFLRPGWAFNASHPEDYGVAAEGTPEAELVVNVVVRDIWSRSRLPADELAEVWDLVDKRGDGALGRQEFVVGMWLIDQRLRGRKIPARVGESVWASVRGGLVVPGPKKRR
ncbi:hypothetical protein QBC34DRAFT_12825 [Podospora aff. communis PSN243]|uniref:EH domain-containing protein n=1 Tax=Podospora aff. communis PSN243 TaxID=3040156 RepID=A0AAV9H553_9PEZI|nr:hypothetical protein QBC34DRAFT_12825 [Podospora aff. communis PSN243]